MKRRQKYLILVALFAALSGYSQVQTNILTPQGGGTAEGGSYTSFVSVGGDIIGKTNSGNQYAGLAGFYSPLARIEASDPSDSLALVALYIATNGDEWSNNDNWLTGPLETWFGIRTNAFGQVDSIGLAANTLSGYLPEEIGNFQALSRLELYQNQISGTIPASLGNLTSLNHINLSFNHFEGELPVELFELPNLTFLAVSGNNLSELPEIDTTYSILNENFGTLALRNNYFTFEDFQRFDNRDSIPDLLYPQKMLAAPSDTLLEPGSNYMLPYYIGGSGNTYQWYKDGEILEGATKDTLIISNASAADKGLYQLYAHNAQVPQLTLQSGIFYIDVEGSGTILTEGPEWNSANAFGGAGENMVTSIEVDNDNNILMFGNFQGNFNFFGQEITEADSGAFLAKLDSDYNLLWLKHIKGGKAKNDLGDYMVFDQTTGAMYLAGTFNNETPGLSLDSITIGSFDGEIHHFVAKINAQGQAEWIKEFPQHTVINDLSARNGVLIVSGIYNANTTLEGHNLVHHGINDVFVASYLENGQNTFVRTAGGVDMEYFVLTALDEYGNIYATSEATSPVMYYESGDSLVMNEGAGNVMVIKYDPNGTILWDKIYSGSTIANGDYYSWPTAITIDPFGNAVIMGWYGQNASFGSDTLKSPFGYNKYITQLNQNGEVNWARDILEKNYGFNYNELETDEAGNIYFMSDQRGALFIEGSQYPLAGINDLYIIKYNQFGGFEWIKNVTSSTATNSIRGMGVAREDVLFVGGNFQDPELSFDEHILSSPDFTSGFISSIGRLENSSSDSLALVALYNATNGAEWTNSENWLVGPLETWYGIRINKLGQVDSIGLATNNLTGYLPEEMGSLQALSRLELYQNQISGTIPGSLGNLTSLALINLSFNQFEGELPVGLFELPNLTFLAVSGNNLSELPEIDNSYTILNKNFGTLALRENYFTFEDFQRFDNRDSIPGPLYPQKMLVAPSDTLLEPGSNYILPYYIGGSGNTYQWYKNGEILEGASGDTLLIINASATDRGLYQLLAYNAQVPQLILQTETFYVDVSGTEELAEGPEWTSAHAYGGDNGNFTSSIEIDGDGNIIMYGNFYGDFDFFGQQITAADSGAYLAKLDLNYNLLSLTHIRGGTAIRDIGDYLIYDDITGSTYVAGTIVDEITVGTMNYTSLNPGEKNGYVIRFDAAGDPVWIKEMPLFTTVYDLSANNGDIIISGLYFENTTLEGVSLNHIGESDFYIAKYNEEGQNIFVKSVAGEGPEYLIITAVDNAGNIYATSEPTSPMLHFEDGSSLVMEEGAGNVIVIKYDASGNRLWENLYSGSGNTNGDYSSWPTAITTDPTGNPVLMGWYGMKNGFGADTLTSPFTYNKFITQLAPDGSVNWAKAIFEKTQGFNYNEMETDEAGNIYFMSSQTDDIYIAGSIYRKEGALDKYIVKYTSLGEAEWIKRVTNSTQNVFAQGLGVVEEDVLLIGGGFRGEMAFGQNTISSPDFSSGFIASIGTKSSLSLDSLALVAIYEATDGDNWSNNTGWLIEPVSEWHGVISEGNRVTGLDLSGNNLTGTIPADITTITKLSAVDFSNNSIKEIPDMSGLDNLTSLNLSGNKLEFGSLEANAGISGINYQDQDSIGSQKYIEIAVGMDTAVSITTTGDFNAYQWFRNGTPVQGATNSSLNIPAISRATMGEYYAEITNTKVPDLTLRSRITNINATVDIAGQVRLSGGTPLPDGEVILLEVTTGGFDSAYVTNVDQNGFYNFEAIIIDDYLLVAVADTSQYPDEFPTYFPNAFFWEEADTLRLESNIPNLDIDLIAIDDEEPTGKGVISGTLEEEVPEEGRLAARKRVAGAGVSVRRVDRAGRVNKYPNSRMMEDFVLVAFTYTDENGNFVFTNLEPDTYYINIQYPGFPMDESSDIAIDIGDKASGSEVRTVEALVDQGRITVTANRVVGIKKNNSLRITIYPNPARDFINIILPEGNQDDYDLVLRDSKGIMIHPPLTRESGKMVVEMQGYAKGVYILNIYDVSSNQIIDSYKVILSD